MKINTIFWVAILCMATFFYSKNIKAQYLDLSGTNPDIKQYVEENSENWNRSIIYLFYSNDVCPLCAKAMGEIYDIYQKNYSNKLSLFEINYEAQGEFDYQIDYQLNQPLSVVLVRVNDGMSRGFYKIDNPQKWLDNPWYFQNNLTEAINNFLID